MRVYTSLNNLLQQDIANIIAHTLGSAVLLVIRFFLGSYVANGIKYVFQSYCHAMNIVVGGHPGKHAEAPPKEPDMPYGEDYYIFQQSLLPGNEKMYTKQRKAVVADDYELHDFYQQMVDQEPSKSPAKPTWPSYMMIARAIFVYCLLQVATPQEIYQYAKTTILNVRIDTVNTLWFLVWAFMLHAVLINISDWITMIEMLFNPGLNHIQMAKRSIRTQVSKALRKSVQNNLHSYLSLLLSLLTVGVLGLLSTILAFGVVHDVHGILSQTHERVTKLQQQPRLFGEAKGLTADVDRGLSGAYESGLQWLEPILKDAFPVVGWTPLEWAMQLSDVVVAKDPCSRLSAYSLEAEGVCLKPVVQDVLETTPFWVTEQEYTAHFMNETVDFIPEAFHTHSIPTPADPPLLVDVPLSWEAIRSKLSGSNSVSSLSAACLASKPTDASSVAINLSQIQFLVDVLRTHRDLDMEMVLAKVNWFNEFLFCCILFMLTLITLTGLKVSPLQRVGWLIDQALTSSSSMGSLQLPRSSSPGRVLAKHLEFAISGTFFAMFKLSVYRILFTVVWTRQVALWAAKKVAFPESLGHPFGGDVVVVDDFVPVKYAWLTSLVMVVLTLFPIAPSWIASIPGAVVHFFIYGQQKTLAVLLILGHVMMAMFVDGPVWDTYVVKAAQPGTSSAFWLGLWVYLGGMRWGTKGLLVGPVIYAAVPAAWAAILEMRGRPDSDEQAHFLERKRSKKANGRAAGHSSLQSSGRHHLDYESESASGSDYDSDSI
ncbi:hypothetical protein BGZ73_002587 [Actinomortierella ambigua]|nr:hypothetical protein BGZ73_002587 [Actinomortierella ambigua]